VGAGPRVKRAPTPADRFGEGDGPPAGAGAAADREREIRPADSGCATGGRVLRASTGRARGPSPSGQGVRAAGRAVFARPSFAGVAKLQPVCQLSSGFPVPARGIPNPLQLKGIHPFRRRGRGAGGRWFGRRRGACGPVLRQDAEFPPAGSDYGAQKRAPAPARGRVAAGGCRRWGRCRCLGFGGRGGPARVATFARSGWGWARRAPFGPSGQAADRSSMPASRRGS
jgi:hypothetical protein